MQGSWKMEEYTIETLDKEFKDKTIEVPKYQRGSVWSKQQKERLIDSMNQGFPFGSILLYKKGEKKQIIDGLQRSTTIIEFVSDPSHFFVEANMDDRIIIKIAKQLNIENIDDKIVEDLKVKIKSWVKETHNSMKEIKKMQYNRLTKVLLSTWPEGAKNSDGIDDSLEKLFEDFQNLCDSISTMKIPALVYQGDEENLPEIFERINSQGSKLTKQQIYAATWASDTIVLESKKFENIIQANIDRYDNMLTENMELDDYNSKNMKKEKEINVFELVFGFGKMISQKYPYLFNYDDNDKTKVESIGFNLINACLGLKSGDMRKLNKTLKDKIGLDTENIEKFLLAILESIDYVDGRLGTIIKFKGNTRGNSKPIVFHAEMQIVSIIAFVFLSKYATISYNAKDEVSEIVLHLDSLNSNWNKTNDSIKKGLDENLLKVYAIDVLDQNWKGSGDKKLDKTMTDKLYYTRTVEWKEFDRVLDGFFENMNNDRRERKQVSNPKEQERLILNMIYAYSFKATDQIDSSRYDIEHLATKNLMKQKLSAYREDFKLPISSVGNLCLLPEYDNRLKQDKTLYQDKNYLEKVDIEYVENKYSFTKEEDLAWLNENNLDENEFKEHYLNFITKRYEVMKEKIRHNLFEK